MPMEVTVANPQVLDRLAADIAAMGRDFASTNRLRRPFERMRDEVMIPSIGTNFQVGGRPKWEPLAQATIDRGGSTPLVRSGILSRTAVAKSRFRILKNEMTYGNWPERRWFGPVHNLPEIASRAGIPARPFTLFQPEDIEAIDEIMLEWIEETVNKNIKMRYV